MPLLPTLTLVLATALAQEGPPQPAGEGQRVEDALLTDFDHGFTLRAPAGWQLLDEERARAIMPDLVAGAVGPGGHLGVVIVEEAATDIEAMNQIVLGGLGDALVETISQETLQWKDLPAIRSELSLQDRGIRLRQSRVVFEWDRHFFQVICNGPPEPAENRCAAFLDAFELSRTAVRPRGQIVAQDVIARGWRIHEGVYESASEGVALVPPDGWRLVVGDELAQLSPDASVGLARVRPEAYAYLVPERIGEGALPRIHEQYRATFLEAISPEEPGTVEAGVVGEAPIELLRVRRGEPMPFTYWHGDFARGAQAWQVVAWAPNASADEVTPQIHALLQGFRPLAADERAALERALLAAPSPADVGVDWSLRRQRWTHYGLGLQWSPPPGLWNVLPGQGASSTWADGLLAVEQLVSGANAALRPLPDMGSLAESHDALVASLGGPEAKAEKVKVGGRKAYASWLHTVDPIPLTWRITSFEAPNGQQYAWMAYALTTNAADADLAMVAGATQRAEGVEARHLDARRFESHRLGIALDLVEPLPCYDPVPDRVRSVADGLACVQGDRGIVLMAVREGSAGIGGEEVMTSLAEGMLGQEIGRISRADARRGKGSLAGLESTRLSFGPSGSRMELDLISRDRVVIIYGQMGMVEADRERWRAALRLLED